MNGQGLQHKPEEDMVPYSRTTEGKVVTFDFISIECGNNLATAFAMAVHHKPHHFAFAGKF